MAYLFTLPKTRALSNSVLVIPGSRLYFYETGTSNQKNTYVDRDLNTPHTNPVISDEFGTFPVIWLDTATGFYRVVQTDNLGITVMSPIDEIGDDPVIQDTQASIGALLFPRTQAEQNGGVTPINYWYEPGDVRRYGATGDGSTDDTTAFANALLSNKLVIVPDPSSGYKLTAILTIPTNVVMRGYGKHSTKLLHAYNGDMIDLRQGASLEYLYLEGQGATFTGKGIIFTGSNGKQRIYACKVINFDGACFDYAVTAGSQSSHIDIEAFRTAAGTGTGRYAFVISATQQLLATPRKYTHIETAGQCSFDFGGSNDTFLSDSFLADLAFTDDSRGVSIVASRVANQANLTIRGHQVSIIGCDLLPNLALEGSGPINLVGNSVVGTVTDNTTAGTSLVEALSASYTPAWTGSVSNPAIGDGTLRGEFSRQGDCILLAIELIIGSTTTFGSGTWQFTVPKIPVPVSGTTQIGQVYILDSGIAIFQGIAILTNGATFMTVQIPGGTTSVTPTIPMTWATGDVMRVDITYRV